MDDKTKNLAEQADKVNHDQRIESQKLVIKDKERALKEAKEYAERAAANDGPRVSVSQGGPEMVRTQTLAEQAEVELAEAKTYLTELQGDQEPGDVMEANRVRAANPATRDGGGRTQ